MILNMWLALFLVCMTSLCSCEDVRPEVKAPYGTFKGHVIKSKGGRDLLAFTGIPYAQPPIGKLRFKEPVKVEKHEGIFEANQDRVCIQPKEGILPQGKTQSYVGKEDCLYLNVYVPKVKSKDLLPVYFWIHGGGYIVGSGSKDLSSPGIILDKNRDMIMVSINYRLGVLGFLNAEDKNLPDNVGMKDQTMALRWVKENIKAFGGDPNSVTIAGISAGGSSVALHLRSKASKGLFHRAVSQSGTADCSWAMKSTKEARQIASKIISDLECPTESQKLVECLQELPVETILDSLNAFQVKEVGIRMVLAPVLEEDTPNAFITRKSFEEGSELPWLAGATNEEALLFYQFAALAEPRFNDLSILKSDAKKLLPIAAYYTSHPDPDKLTQKLLDHYFKDGFSDDTVKHYVQLLSDFMFYHGIHRSVSNYKGKLYLYMLSYKGKMSTALIRPKGTANLVSHGDDLYFFFPKYQGLSEWTLNEKDEELSNTMMDMWYNFVKNGDPTPETHIWKESDGGKNYLDITNDGLFMAKDMLKERITFIDSFSPLSNVHEEL